MDDVFMRRALDLAEEAYQAGEVPIGCVLIDPIKKRVIGEGRNRTNETKNATRHAEFEAIDQIIAQHGKDFDFNSLHLYVTIEPCIMCASALRRLGVRKCFYGAANERFGGCGSVVDAHTERFNQVDPPLEAIQLQPYRRECVMLLRRFYMLENERAPKPKKKTTRVLKELE